MATSIFDIKTEVPNDNNVAEALGNAKHLWDKIESYIFENYNYVKKEWKYYSKKAGWSLVFKNKDSTLLYFIPCKESFRIWFVLGEKAVNTALKASLPKYVIETITTAKPYTEGRGFFVDVKEDKDLPTVMTLIEIKTQS